MGICWGLLDLETKWLKVRWLSRCGRWRRCFCRPSPGYRFGCWPRWHNWHCRGEPHSIGSARTFEAGGECSEVYCLFHHFYYRVGLVFAWVIEVECYLNFFYLPVSCLCVFTSLTFRSRVPSQWMCQNFWKASGQRYLHPVQSKLHQCLEGLDNCDHARSIPVIKQSC